MVLDRPTRAAMAATLVVSAAVACESATAPARGTGPLIQTGASEYELEQIGEALRVDVPYVFENRTAALVHLQNCLGGFHLHLERSEGVEWLWAWSPALFACLSSTIVIDVGETFADTLHIVGFLPGSSSGPQFDRADPSGTYRFVWDAARTASGDTLAFGDRVSNPFVLTVP
jgi:hypothetical protein